MDDSKSDSSMSESNHRDDIVVEPTRRNWISYIALLAVQGQNAFNDNAVRWLLAVLGAAYFAELAIAAGEDPADGFYENILAMLAVLPFIIFSPFAGWLADRFSKKTVIVWAMIYQIIAFLIVGIGVSRGSLAIATFAFFLLALQSALMSPAKNGILKEYVGKNRLGLANGGVQFVLILSILAGSIVGAFWYGRRFDETLDVFGAGVLPVWVFAAGTIIPLALCLGMEPTHARNPGKPFSVKLFYSHFGELAMLLKTKKLRLPAIGVAWFWIFALTSQLITFGAARDLTNGQIGMGAETARMLASASVGIAIGSAMAAYLGRQRIRLGLIPVGGLGMAVSCLLISFQAPGEWPFYLILVLVGGMAATFYVPTFAYFQDIVPEKRRGRLLATTNIMGNVGMVLAAAAQAGMSALGASPGLQFLLLGMVSMVAAFYVIRILPLDFLRALLVPYIRIFYRLRVSGRKNVPKKGGVLMICNHVSFVDGFLIGAACPRPVRFVVGEEYYNMWWATWFFRLVGAVPIAPLKAKDAIRKIAAALEKGQVVCIFPEGRLTRDGEVAEFQKGFKLISRQARVPVQPVCVDGIWGSLLSLYGGRLLWKLPRRGFAPVTVRFGEPLDGDDVDVELAREAVIKLLEKGPEGKAVLGKPVPQFDDDGKES